MPTRTFTEGPDTFTASTDEDFVLYFQGGNDRLTQNQPASGVYAEMGTGDDRAVLQAGDYFQIVGNDGNDRFDVLYRPTNYSYILGGVGNDTIVAADGAGNFQAYGEEGSDTFRVGAVSNVYLSGGIGNDRFYGSSNEMVSVTIDGGDGQDAFYGFSEGATLRGGAGNDLYRIDPNGAAAIVEGENEGIDSVQVAVGADYSLVGTNLENISVQAFAVVDNNATLTGNDLNNVISGSSADEVIYGLGGDDKLVGGAGTDTMIGGLGNDLYYVERDGDLTIENAGEGTDTVRLNLSTEVNLANETTADDVATYQLQDNIENLILQVDIQHNISANDLDNYITGRAAADEINGQGGDDLIYGNAGDDTLRGNAGNDQLFGGIGNDTLRGGDGNDILRGQAGADDMAGGAGNDTYFVDEGDIVTEGADEGQDMVYTSLSSYSLGANIESARGTGDSIVLTGNGLDNGLAGTQGADVLSDTIGGSDTFAGLRGADIIQSSADGNVDVFAYYSVADSNVTDGYDRVFGVEGGAGGDIFDLSDVDANSTIEGNQDFVYVGDNAFSGNAGELRVDGDFIQGDTNGDGVADFQIEYDVGTGPGLTIDNFLLSDPIVMSTAMDYPLLG